MRIEVRTPAEVSEVSRALQRANQRRLADRQADGWAERDAVRLVQRAQSKADSLASRAAKADPWKGAIPEFDPPLEVRAKIMGKRFKVAGAYFQWRTDGRLLIWTADKEQSATINLPVGPQWYEVLPAGGDRLVLLFYGYSFDVQYQDHTEQMDTGWLPGAPNITGGGNFFWHPGTTRNRTVTTEYWRTATASLTDYRAMVTVRKDSISYKMSWPDPLRQIIERKYTCAKSLRKTTSPNGVSFFYREYAQSISTNISYNTSPYPPVPITIFGPGTGEVLETLPQYNSDGTYNDYGGGPWVPVTSYGLNDYVYKYSPHPAADPATMLVTGRYVFYTPSGYAEDYSYAGSHSNEDYEVVFTPNAYQSPTLLQYNTGGVDAAIAFVWHPLMRSYGYGHLVNRDADGQTPGWGWTPAVFSFLKNYTGEFHKEDGDTSMLTKALSYQHARDNYIPLDAPPYFLTADVTIPDAEGDTTKIYYYFRAPAYDISLDYSNPLTFRTEGNTIAPVTLRPNRGEYTTEVIRPLATSQRSIEISELAWTSHEIPVAAWDWDRPLACWIELIRLGFTPDDLMLSADEQKAMYEADWALAAFKF